MQPMHLSLALLGIMWLMGAWALGVVMWPLAYHALRPHWVQWRRALRLWPIPVALLPVQLWR